MGEATWSWKHLEHIPSSEEAGRKAIEKLLQALTDTGWEGRDYFHIQMAAEEAMVNAVRHGNQLSGNKSVEVEFRVSEHSAYLRFKDEGEGFCPDDLPDPRDDENLECVNGRGVMLIKEMMSEVTYNVCGTEVIMVKHRTKE